MAPGAELPRRTVLVVDDSRFVRATFRAILQASFEVKEAADGEAGWQAVESDESIVMVFSDISMPKLDGFGLLDRIRRSALERIKNLPVVVISGEESESTRLRVRDSGANDFIAKSADAPEVLARIDNLLRLVNAKQEAESSRKALEHGAIRDPLTGAFTPRYLLTEGRKHYSHASRHGGPLSVVMLRVDTYGEIAKQVGKDVADQLLAHVARVVTGALRAEDSLGRTAEASFTVISASSGPAEALTFARRLRDQLQNASVKYHGRPLPVRISLGIASLAHDAAASLEELVQLALQRLRPAAERVEERRPPPPRTVLPPEVERAVRTLEGLDLPRLGERSVEVVRRLLPLLESAFSRLRLELPTDKIRGPASRKEAPEATEKVVQKEG